MLEHQNFFLNSEGIQNWGLLKLGEDGIPVLDFGSTPFHELFSCCHGVEINQKTGTIRIILEPVREADGAPPLFQREDILQVLGGNVEHPALNLGNASTEPWCVSYTPSTMKDTDILMTMMHTLHWIHELVHESPDEFIKQLPPHLKENMVEIIKNDDTFFIEVGEVEINRRTVNEEIVFQFGEVHISIKTQNSDDANAPFAKFLTNHFLEIGKHFEILLRLRELVKLCAVCEILIDKRRCIQNLKNALEHHTGDITPLEEIFPHMFAVLRKDEHHVEKELADYRFSRNPPHPIYSEDNVQREWRMQESGHYYRDGRGTGEKERILNHIRDHLRHQDLKRFDQMATHISTRYHVHFHEVRPLIPFYLDKNPSILSQLSKMCCDSLIQKRIKEIVASFQIELDIIGIRPRSPVVDSPTSLPKSVGGVCLATKLHYVPTYICLGENENILFLSLRNLKSESTMPQSHEIQHKQIEVEKVKNKPNEMSVLEENISKQGEVLLPALIENQKVVNEVTRDTFANVHIQKQKVKDPFRSVAIILSWI